MNKKYYFLAILIFVLVVVVEAFGWFEIRPSNIKHECSWVRMVDPAIPAEPAITKEEAENSKLEYNRCISNQTVPENDGWAQANLEAKRAMCERFVLKQERQAILAQPEHEWYRKARETEYNFCIHEKGL